LKTKCFSSTLKNALAYSSAGEVFVNSEFVGLAPGKTLEIFRQEGPDSWDSL
jgi:hypothetical protein